MGQNLEKYARLREEAIRLFKSIRKLAKAAGISHANISLIIYGKYPASDAALKKKLEAAFVDKDPDFDVRRLWDVTEEWHKAYPAKGVIEVGEKIIKVDGEDFELVAVYRKVNK